MYGEMGLAEGIVYGLGGGRGWRGGRLPLGSVCSGEGGIFERAPFELLLVAAAWDAASGTLLAVGMGLVAL